MNELIQWCACVVIGLAALAYLGLKYVVRKEIPGAACGKCKACSTVSRFEQLALGAGATARKRLPLRRP